MIQLNAFPNVWPPSLKTNVRDFLSELSPANWGKKKKNHKKFTVMTKRLLTFYIHSPVKGHQWLVLFTAMVWIKLWKQLKVMNLKCKYRPKSNIKECKLTLDLCSRLLITSLIHSVPWARNKSFISLLHIPKLCLHQRKVLQHNHTWATTLHLKLIFGSMLLWGGPCGAKDSRSQIC